MAIRYTVTTITKRCPYCGKTIDEETHGQFTPLLGILLFLTFPIAIPYLLIRFLLLKDPNFPPIGPKYFSCPHCALPIRTGNYAREELQGTKLFLHKFKTWIYVCYAIGAVFGISVMVLLLENMPLVSWWGLVSLISISGIIAIVFVYYTKLEDVSNIEQSVNNSPKITEREKLNFEPAVDTSCIYCRKCGTKLPVDSQFCNKCGTKIMKC